MASSPGRFNGQPAQAVDIPFLCQQYVNASPVLEERYDRLLIKTQDRVQSRIDKNNAPDGMVHRYSKLMSETTFPAILLTEDNHIIDGNTRTKAHAKREDRYIRAWVLPVAWETADAGTREKLLLLSLALNSMNGLPLDEGEMFNYATVMIHAGSSDEEVMGKTGLPLAKISSLRDRQRALTRLKAVGIDVETTDAAGNKKTVIPELALRAFGKPNALKLDDDMVTNLFNLTKEAGLKGTQVNSLATSLNEQTSEDSRRERLARERKHLEAQILANRGGQSVPMQCEWLRGAITRLIEKPVSAFVESNPEKAAEYSELLVKGMERLQEITAAQLHQQPMATSLGQEATH